MSVPELVRMGLIGDCNRAVVSQANLWISYNITA